MLLITVCSCENLTKTLITTFSKSVDEKVLEKAVNNSILPLEINVKLILKILMNFGKEKAEFGKIRGREQPFQVIFVNLQPNRTDKQLFNI